MYSALLERALRNFRGVRQHIQFSEAIRTNNGRGALCLGSAAGPHFDASCLFNGAPESTDWKVIDHCSAVTRIYGIFEQFVHSLLEEYLTFLEKNFDYAELESDLKANHRRGIGQVLVNLDKDRFSSLSLGSIVGDFARGLTGSEPYRLLPEALITHDQNLRMGELNALLGRCGIPNAMAWINKHRKVREFFDEGGRYSGTAETELNQLVYYRNEAAHGGVSVDSVLGADVLAEFADFCAVVCSALTECVYSATIDKAVQAGKFTRCGIVSEVFKQNKNAAVAIVSERTFSVGDAVTLKGEAYCYRVRISSIHENDTPVVSKTVLEETELGFLFDSPPIKRANIFYL